jgi:hypothetical protein
VNHKEFKPVREMPDLFSSIPWEMNVEVLYMMEMKMDQEWFIL